MGLLCGEDCVILTLIAFDWYTRVTDGQTDGRGMAYSSLPIHFFRHFCSGSPVLGTRRYNFQPLHLPESVELRADIPVCKLTYVTELDNCREV